MTYLSAQELSELVGCQPNRYTCMRRWLTRNRWPFEISINGFPIVSRKYHDARMSGQLPVAAESKARSEPNFDALK